MMELIDIGANLTHSSFRKDLQETLTRAQDAGISRIIVTGASAQSSAEAAETATHFPDYLCSTVGIHPHEATTFDDRTQAYLQSLTKADTVVALGEMGLDFNRDYSPRDVQINVFEAQLELALDIPLPLFLHQRDAHEDFLQILGKYRPRLGKAVVHCFTGSRSELHDYLDMDMYIGITGWFCDERRGQHLRELVHDIPANRLMIETDAPYLLPRNMKPAPKNRRNEPAFLPHILHSIANCIGKEPSQLAAETTRTAREFFNLPDQDARSIKFGVFS